MKIEVIIYDRIGKYSPGDIVEIEDGVFLRALLKGGKADVLNPPDWNPDTYVAPGVKSKIKSPRASPYITPGEIDGESNSQQDQNRETASSEPRRGKRSRKTSESSVESPHVNRPEGYREFRELSQDSNND